MVNFVGRVDEFDDLCGIFEGNIIRKKIVYRKDEKWIHESKIVSQKNILKIFDRSWRRVELGIIDHETGVFGISSLWDLNVNDRIMNR